MNEKCEYAGLTDLTGKRHNRGVMKTCVRNERTHEMVNEDYRHSEGAKDIQIRTALHNEP